MYYKDFRPNAPHRSTLIGQTEYMRRLSDEASPPSALFKSPGMCIDYLIVDSMHAGDQGVFADIVGSVLWVEISCKIWYPSQAEGLKRLNMDLKNYYAANRDLRLSSAYPLSLSQIKSRNDPYPTFSGKAAQCRHLSDFVLLLARRHKYGTPDRPAFYFTGRLAGQEAVHLDAMEAMCEGMSDFHRSCKAEPFQADECKASMYRCLSALDVLHKLWRQGLPAKEAKQQPFHVRPKAHEMHHLIEEKLPLWGSPSSFWCYRDEDFIGATKKVASKSLHPKSIEKRVMEKLLILASLGFAA
jgi:hypothetical protein